MFLDASQPIAWQVMKHRDMSINEIEFLRKILPPRPIEERLSRCIQHQCQNQWRRVQAARNRQKFFASWVQERRPSLRRLPQFGPEFLNQVAQVGNYAALLAHAGAQNFHVDQ